MELKLTPEQEASYNTIVETLWKEQQAKLEANFTYHFREALVRNYTSVLKNRINTYVSEQVTKLLEARKAELEMRIQEKFESVFDQAMGYISGFFVDKMELPKALGHLRNDIVWYVQAKFRELEKDKNG